MRSFQAPSAGQRVLNLSERDHQDGLSRIDGKYRPVWEPLPAEQQMALARYFLPAGSSKPVVGPTRPRLIKWYCPFAGQTVFPSGHRYCINTYTGCSHRCRYCYAGA